MFSFFYDQQYLSLPCSKQLFLSAKSILYLLSQVCWFHSIVILSLWMDYSIWRCRLLSTLSLRTWTWTSPLWMLIMGLYILFSILFLCLILCFPLLPHNWGFISTLLILCVHSSLLLTNQLWMIWSLCLFSFIDTKLYVFDLSFERVDSFLFGLFFLLDDISIWAFLWWSYSGSLFDGCIMLPFQV